MVALDVFIAAGRAEALDGGVGGVAVIELEHTDAAEALELMAEPEAFAGLGGVDRVAVLGARLGKDDVFAVALSALFFGERLAFCRRGDGDARKDGNREENSEAKERGFQREARVAAG
ncbi:MAG TPA: hypothetical protein VHD62_09295 [Opitutaceae bacterium]|nr:hypothetical protein [Opitutaceae bacterium]